MPTCATKHNTSDYSPLCNLFLPLPDTDFRDFLHEIEKLARYSPEIINAIDEDLDAHAREKKKLRLADRRFYESRTAELPALKIEHNDIEATELELGIGRPRMPAYAVFVFLMIRGFLGSLTTKQARRFLCESMSLYGFLHSRGLVIPPVTTILENVNLLTHATRELILDRQIALIAEEELDDFKKTGEMGTDLVV